MSGEGWIRRAGPAAMLGGALLMAVGPIWLFASFMAGLGQTVLPIVVPVAVTALGWMWLGYALFAETRAPSAEPASAVR